MGLWNSVFMPRLVACACSSPALERYRRQLLPQARGRVLELGCGSGLNFPFYDSERVDSLIAIEPDPKMLGWARRQASALGTVATDFVEDGIEGARLPTASVDTAVLTFVLCTIPGWESALQEVRRVLKPDGQLLFCEHGQAPDVEILRWQRRVEPLWKRIAGGCHLTRDVAEMLAAGGFELSSVEAAYAPKVPKIAGFVSRGVARLC